MILVVDNVRSKENIGALFRTADGVGVHEVVLCGIAPCPVNRFGVADGKIAKAALGATSSVSWRYAPSTKEAAADLRTHGVYVIVLEQAPSAHDLFSLACTEMLARIPPTQEIALVVGHEVDGVSREVLARADVAVCIPMHGSKESLNVSVAAGIALYTLKKYRS